MKLFDLLKLKNPNWIFEC